MLRTQRIVSKLSLFPCLSFVSGITSDNLFGLLLTLLNNRLQYSANWTYKLPWKYKTKGSFSAENLSMKMAKSSLQGNN
jgi:hypothetical protein